MPARFDRYLTLSVFHPLNRVGFGKTEKCVPILMYHSVSDDPETGVNPYYRLATSPQRFAEQMQWLSDFGYMGVSLEAALAHLASGKTNGRRPVAITFDDGFRDFHTAAWPVLQRHHFSATMYLPTAFIATHRKSFRNKECLTWREVRELRAQGARFGSHTVNHPKLHDLSPDQIAVELAESKATIEHELGEEISSFAYPYAFPQEDRAFTKMFSEQLLAQGYRSCATTAIGRTRAGDDPLRLKRLPANTCDDQPLFAAKLNGAYDWLAVPQSLVRYVKARAR
jgi:peptidoglycan/xylan/chitin deacetylase (PgdA/CDA1 family)